MLSLATAQVLDAMVARVRTACAGRDPATQVLDGPSDREGIDAPDGVVIGMDASVAEGSDPVRADISHSLGMRSETLLVTSEVMSWSGNTDMAALRRRAFALLDVVVGAVGQIGEDVPGVWGVWLVSHAYRPLEGSSGGAAASVQFVSRVEITRGAGG